MYDKTKALYEIRVTNRYRAIAMTCFIATVILMTIILFTGCKKKETPNNTEPQKTTFNFMMTDAPGDYDAVFIELIGAEVHSDIQGWVTLNVIPGIYNLLDLTNGKDTLIASGPVTVGKVSQIRLILGTNNSVVVDNKVYALSTPSAQQSGLKLQVHAELIAGIAYTMLIDFDADKSIVDHGNDKYSLKPVLRVVTKALDGAIQGVALPLASQAAVYAVIGTDSFSTYANATTGGFYIGGLKAGSYKVILMPKAPFKDSAVSGINVVAGAVTNIGIITVK
jgi:hypothetical protein